jgi:hypothetical protein
VPSFSEELVGWADYQGFTRSLVLKRSLALSSALTSTPTVALFGLWVVGNCSYLGS